MKRAVLTLPAAEARLVVGSPAAILTMPRQTARLVVGAPSVPLTMPGQRALLVCEDELAATFTTPTLVSWSVLVEDLGVPGARMSVVAVVTAGSPCRIKLTLIHASASEDYATKYSSPDQLTPHSAAMQFDVTAIGDRGLTYDLYWSWTSGNQSAGPTLVAAAAVYIPNNGEGDFPASG